MEEMLTTRPRLPFFIRGTACCVVNRAAVRLIAIVEFHRSSSTSASGAVLATPALFTRTSHRSSSSVSHANSAATDSAADTSTCLPNAFPPRAEISVATASARLPSRSAMTTVNPSADSRRAIASPIPAALPVTTATAESPTGLAANGRPLSAATSFMVCESLIEVALQQLSKGCIAVGRLHFDLPTVCLEGAHPVGGRSRHLNDQIELHSWSACGDRPARTERIKPIYRLARKV